jgi:hypothetical protein
MTRLLLMKIEFFLKRIAVVSVSLAATILVVQPVGARMIGGPNCVQTQTKVSSKEPLILSYDLTCGDEQAEVAESPEKGGFMAKVKRAGNTYTASDGFMGSGKTIDAFTGNHLPQGTEGEGQGRISILDETWTCIRDSTAEQLLQSAPGNRGPYAVVAQSQCQVAP